MKNDDNYLNNLKIFLNILIKKKGFSHLVV